MKTTFIFLLALVVVGCNQTSNNNLVPVPGPSNNLVPVPGPSNNLVPVPGPSQMKKIDLIKVLPEGNAPKSTKNIMHFTVEPKIDPSQYAGQK